MPQGTEIRGRRPCLPKASKAALPLPQRLQLPRGRAVWLEGSLSEAESGLPPSPQEKSNASPLRVKPRRRRAAQRQLTQLTKRHRQQGTRLPRRAPAGGRRGCPGLQETAGPPAAPPHLHPPQPRRCLTPASPCPHTHPPPPTPERRTPSPPGRRERGGRPLTPAARQGDQRLAERCLPEAGRRQSPQPLGRCEGDGGLTLFRGTAASTSSGRRSGPGPP